MNYDGKSVSAIPAYEENRKAKYVKKKKSNKFEIKREKNEREKKWIVTKCGFLASNSSCALQWRCRCRCCCLKFYYEKWQNKLETFFCCSVVFLVNWSKHSRKQNKKKYDECRSTIGKCARETVSRRETQVKMSKYCERNVFSTTNMFNECGKMSINS